MAPSRPAKIPFPPTEENIPKLKAYLEKSFESTAFNRSAPFPAMKIAQGHIHLKPGAIPYARHTPITIPIHWKESIKAQIDDDVQKGIIKPVDIGEPVVWCSPMVVVRRPDGTPRRTVDYQNLNRQCYRETHHSASPFILASKVPPNTRKTIIDAVDSYHSIALDKESQHLTTFITEWGRYQYMRMPQGFIASGDAFVRRYDELTKNVNNHVKIVDDALLYDNSIEESFWSTWDYLSLCAENGVVANKSKFKFCQMEIDFGGLHLTKSGIAPSESMLSAIENFPAPTDLKSARAWFGLVNQVSWAYSISSIMQPFRGLIKPNIKFYWDDTLDKLFKSSKASIISKVKEGVQSFNVNKRTCLQTDWCKTGIGYLLLQKHCDCPEKSNLRCCSDGWKFIFAGSRLTKPAESRYSPTEGECLSVSWSLHHLKPYTLGCTNFFISVDHKPLLGILNNRDLADIDNPRLQSLKESTFPWTFEIYHNPGKWHRGPNSVSRNPAPSNSDTFQAFSLFCQESSYSNDGDANVQALSIKSLQDLTKNAITLDIISDAAKTDDVYLSLLQTIMDGFPEIKNETSPSIRDFWQIRNSLSVHGHVAYFGERIVIAQKLRKQILEHLHSAHQGVTGMKNRANCSIYWPGLSNSISNFRRNCNTCEKNAPSQRQEPLVLSESPEWPFQNICGDYFVLQTHTYLVIVDRFSGWPIVYHFKPDQATSGALINALRDIFIAYGAAEEFCSDGGPQFSSTSFDDFLKFWGVHHRKSSVSYPQSNGRAELGVKSMKRLIEENSAPDGSLNTNKFAAAMLQYRNTPIPDLELSPAQLLLHRQLKDTIPSHPKHYQVNKDWILSAIERESLYAKRNKVVEQEYNRKSHSLPPLSIGTQVLVQKSKKWSDQGVIVEVMPHRQYRIRMLGSGRITLRNRRYLKPCISIQPSCRPASPPSASPSSHASPSSPTSPASPSSASPPSVPIVKDKIPRALLRLQSHNKRGLKET